MLINANNIAMLYRSFKAIFSDAYMAMTATSLWPRVATEVPSTTKQNDYGWLSKFPRMREWVGERVINNLSASSYTIINKDYEATIGVDRNDLDDDNLGIYNPLMRGLADSAASHPDELVFGLLHSGFSSTCYDGQYFFDTDHPVGDSTASNKGTGALNITNYAAARATMMAQTDESGRALNVMPDLLVVPPQLEKAALEILRADKIANGESNVYMNSADLVVAPWLAGNPTEWFLFDTKKPLKPVIFQNRKAPEFVSKTDVSDDNVFMEKEYLFGVDARYNVGYGLWQLAYGSTGAA